MFFSQKLIKFVFNPLNLKYNFLVLYSRKYVTSGPTPDPDFVTWSAQVANRPLGNQM